MSVLSTVVATAYGNRAQWHPAFSSPTRRKAQKSSGFRASGTYRHCIKDNVLIDQACGTGGMLSTGYNFIKRYNPSADVRLFGQEINPESYAMCLAEMLIKGQNAENICYQGTMKADRFKGTKMRFVLEIIWSFIQAIQDVHDEAHSLLAA